MKRLCAGFAALLAVFAFAAVAFAADPPPAAPAEKFGPGVGDKMKPFKLEDPTVGKSFELKDLTAGGKDVALIFMQTACTLCVSEINEFQSAKDDIEGKLGVALISLDFDAKRIAPYKAAYNLSFPILHDGDSAVLESVKFTSTPAIVIVDAKGVIKSKISGYNKAELKNLFKSYK